MMLFCRCSYEELMRPRKETAVSHQTDYPGLRGCLSQLRGERPGSAVGGTVVSKACCCHQYEQDVSAARAGESSTFYEPYFYKNTFREYNSVFVWEEKKWH